VYDSLVTAGPLSGAEVWLVGTPFRAVTDTAGRFHLAGVPAGRYRLTTFHPLLDSLGVASPLVHVGVAPGDSAGVQIALPSERSLFASRCGRPPGPGEGLALGVVLDVDDAAPVAGARVVARWIDYPLTRKRFVRTPRQAATTTGAGGQFALCGIPNDVGLEVDAVAGVRSSGAVTVFLDERLVGFRQLHVARPDTAVVADADTAPRPAAGRDEREIRVPRRGAITLVGRVVNQAGRPVADAVVASHVAALSTRTDSSGAFRLRGLAAGSQDLVVRAIGFEPAVTAVVVRREPEPLTIALDRDAVALPSITVVGRRESRWDRTGFENRRWVGRGKFITREDVAARSAASVPDLLRGVSGIEVTRDGSEDVVVVRRGARVCRPDVYLDGLYVPDGASQLKYLVIPGRVVGMEVYAGMTAPDEFIRTVPPCGSVVIWTTWSSRR
jgi:hypothetical protein